MLSLSFHDLIDRGDEYSDRNASIRGICQSPNGNPSGLTENMLSKKLLFRFLKHTMRGFDDAYCA